MTTFNCFLGCCSKRDSTAPLLKFARLSTALSGFVQKNPFKIHKLFHKTWHDAHNMVQKTNTKVHNYSAHLVKVHNPYWSQCTLSVKTDRHCVLCDFAWQFYFYFFNLLFGLGKCSFWLLSWQFFPRALKTTKFTNSHRAHSVFTDFQGLEKPILFSPNSQRPSKTANPDCYSNLLDYPLHHYSNLLKTNVLSGGREVGWGDGLHF